MCHQPLEQRGFATRLSAAVTLLLFLHTAASASEWKVVPAKSWLGFEGMAGVVAIEGRFSRWEARIDFDPDQPESGHAVVTVDMTSAETGDQEVDQTLPKAAWFDAKTFPRATVTVQSLRAKGGHAYDATGTLTVRDVTKPIVVPVTIEVDGSTLHAKGHLDLVRTDFDVGLKTTAKWVALEVVAEFDLTAERSP